MINLMKEFCDFKRKNPKLYQQALRKNKKLEKLYIKQEQKKVTK